MAKAHTTLTIDNETLERAKKMNINISGSLQEYLEMLIARESKDIDKINIELERRKLKKAKEEREDINLKIKEYETNIANYEEYIKKQEDKKLQEEKEKIELLKTCINCNKILEEGNKRHEFPIGLICNVCFVNEGKENYKRWMEK